MKKKTNKLENEIKDEINEVLKNSTFDEALMELEEREKNKNYFDGATTIGVDEFHTYQLDMEEDVVLLGFTGYIEGKGEQQEGMMLLYPSQIEAIYSYLKYRQAELDWNKKRHN